MRFSCVIPAFNESGRILPVISTVLACPELDEVIVVNDGSTDDTQARLDSLEHPKLRKISLEANVGKARAIFTGIRASHGDFIVMVDADLIGLKPEHVSRLIAPVREGRADATISLRENSLAIYKLLKNDFVSGERVVPRALLEDEAHYTSGPGFWLEVKMNERLIAGNFRVESVFFPGVIAPRKWYKCGYVQWTISDLRMVRDIMSVVPPHRLALQLWNFYRQQKKRKL